MYIFDDIYKLIQYKIDSVYNILEKNYTYNDDLKTRSLTEDYGTYKVIYTFDEVGHITHIVKLNHHNDMITACYYEYDAFKRLSKETTYDSSNILVSSMSYKYDNRGNIIEVYNDIKHEKLEYQYHEQIKNRLDKVLKYSDGTVIDYVTYNYKSNVFNPDSYHKNNHKHPLQWEGSKLIGHGQSTYTYDEAGIRIKKEAPTGDITYITENNKVVRSIRNDVALTYHYDSNDRLVGFRRHDKEYFYDRDITGNILSIIDSHGNNMVNYAYTAYGIPSKSINENLQGEFINEALSIMEENIFLYKGYIYDYDTNMYYCMSRYYDPEIGRWLSIDDVGYLDSQSVHGLNLYAYCGNNPVMYSDPSGKFAISILAMVIIGTVVGGALGFGFDVGGQLINNGWNFNEVDWGSATNSTIVGAALGFSMAMGVGYLGPVIAGASGASGMAALGAFGVSATVSFGAGALGYASEEWINGRTPDFGKAMMHGGFVAIEGMINFGVGGVIGSMGNIGTKGPNPFRSLEWWGKLTFGQMYTQPSKISIDLIRKNL